MITRLPVLAIFVVLVGQGRAGVVPDEPIVCGACDAWNAPQAPFNVFGNTYYVGTAGLSAVLIASDKGLILLDAPLPQSAAQIDQNIRALGFRTEDIRLIVNSHAHFDHAGAIAAFQRATGATVASSPAGARALEQGRPAADDPQAAGAHFPPVRGVRVVSDGEALRVGSSLAITAHLTPGHTPGSTTWTWQSCEGAKCLKVVYADSLNAVSLPGFRFTGTAAYPSRVDAFRKSIATVAALPCDVLITVHPEFTRLFAKRDLLAKNPSANPFVDANACRAYANMATKTLERRIADEG
jgi:metallo-beta-lactamase class B